MGNNESKRSNSVFANIIRMIFHKGLTLLFGQGILFLLFIFTFVPFLSAIYYAVLNLTGYSYVTVDNIGHFLLNPLALAAGVLLFFLLGLFLLFEMYFLMIYFRDVEDKKKVRLYLLYMKALRQLFLCLRQGGIRLIPAVWLTLGGFNLPLLCFAFLRIRLLKFFTDEMSGVIFLAIAVIATILLIGLLLLQNGFIFQYSLYPMNSYAKLLECSRDTGRNKPVRTLLYFIAWNLLMAWVIFLIYAFTMVVITLLTAAIPDRSLAIATFISVNDGMSGYLMTLAFFICTISNTALFTHLFYRYRLVPGSQESESVLPVIDASPGESGGQKSYRKILRYTLIALLMFNIYSYFNILTNGSPLDYMNLDTIQITSHRGFSQNVPENTLPAIEKAIEEQADYIEIDVRVTRDGELVLLHDSNLKRTTGLDKYIWELDYSQVALLDAGSWVDESYRETRIPTLEEVLELCKGKAILNVELKYMNEEEGLEEKAVELIKKHDMEWQCVISSSSLTCLERVKELDPDLQTGYILYQLHNGLSTNETIDFFSMKSSLVTKSVVQKIHQDGKKLYVWTVNSKNELERLKRLGVDNIITDNPAYAREVLLQSDSDQYFLTLLKVMKE
jgi:glycerophosphoryl diester phosphodiesterase